MFAGQTSLTAICVKAAEFTEDKSYPPGCVWINHAKSP
jgi:hypothetical protein